MRSRASAFTAFTALNGFGFFFLGTRGTRGRVYHQVLLSITVCRMAQRSQRHGRARLL